MKKISVLLLSLILLTLLLTACIPTTPTMQELEGIKIHFIDVGQADGILVQSKESVMLIDGGNNADGDDVVGYISGQGIGKIDILIATHPHEDHIGGLDNVVNAFDIGEVYMPKATANTRTFTDLVKAIKGKGLQANVPKPGAVFMLGEAKCTILAPNRDKYEDTNDYSIVIKLEYGSTAFLFTGDAHRNSEKEMLGKGFDLSADVLKVGHHGSKSSTSKDFLKAVNPRYAVITSGAGNDYGHPHEVTLETLKKQGAEVHRTDQEGTIVCRSDGKKIWFE